MFEVDRRRFLELGTAGTAAAFAGCLGNDSLPGYTEWVPAADDGVVYAGVEMERLTADDGGQSFQFPFAFPDFGGGSQQQYEADFQGLEDPDDPLLALTTRTAGGLLAGAVIGIGRLGLGTLIDPDDPDDSVERVHAINGTGVVTGEIGAERVERRLESGGSDRPGDIRLEPVEETGGYRLYEAVPDGEQLWGAVGEGNVLAAQRRAELVRVIESYTGERDRAVETDGPFEWLADTAGDGYLTVGWSGADGITEFHFGDVTEPVHDVFTAEQHLLASVAFSPADSEMTVDLGMQAPAAGQRREQLASAFRGADGGFSSSLGEGELSVTATYDGDTIEFDAVDDEDGLEQLPEGEDLPAEVEAAVPDNAFEFSYNPDTESVRVEFVEEIDVDEVRLQAVESGYELSTTTPSAGMWVAVQIDPTGDEVVAVVTVDGKSGVVAREQFPP